MAAGMSTDPLQNAKQTAQSLLGEQQRAAATVCRVTWGAAIATVLWLIGSALFSLYVAQFGNYSKTYGSMGAVVILLTWLRTSAIEAAGRAVSAARPFSPA